MKREDMEQYINVLSEARRGSIDDLDELLKAMDVGIRCIKERKLRKRPIRVLDISCFGFSKEQYFVCPDCHRRVEIKDNFCRKCGQPLKWKW